MIKHLLPKLLLVCVLLTISLPGHAQIFKDFTPGYYYDTNGNKTTGLIHLNIWENHILFRADENASKQKIKIQDIQSVIIYNDSLSVQTFDNEKYFAKLALKGAIKLYYRFESHQWNAPMAGMSGPGSNSYGSGRTIRTDYSSYSVGNLYQNTKKTPMYEDIDKTDEITKKKFKDVMTRILAPYPETLKEVIEEKLKFKDMDEIVRRYYHGTLR